MSQLPNQLYKSSLPLGAPMDQSINYLNQGPLPQFVPTQQNTPLTQSMSMNGIQKPINGKDTSKNYINNN
jgi:hypothetical protein